MGGGVVVAPDLGGAGFAGHWETVVDVVADDAGGAVLMGEPGGECDGFVVGGPTDVVTGDGAWGEVVSAEKDIELVG